MILRGLFTLASLALLAAGSPAVRAQAPAVAPAPLPEELVLEGDNIISVTINGQPLRLEVSADAFGVMAINNDVAKRLRLRPNFERRWPYGSASVRGAGDLALIDFGAGAQPALVTWAPGRTASTKADGEIGVHLLPHARVTFALRSPGDGAQHVQRFPLKLVAQRTAARLGTEVKVGKKKLVMIFVPNRAENLVTAGTANFIATHQDGGFEPGSEGIALMNFGLERPTRTMRIAEPIMLGDIAIDRFAVRIEDYGDPDHVGEIGANDPRFDAPQIIVSRRKGRGRPDLMTRIGRDQIAHCSRLTYDFVQSEIRLTCDAGES